MPQPPKMFYIVLAMYYAYYFITCAINFSTNVSATIVAGVPLLIWNEWMIGLGVIPMLAAFLLCWAYGRREKEMMKKTGGG